MKYICIIGHSTAGKSAYLIHKNIDRDLHDFDRYALLNHIKKSTIEDFDCWLSIPREKNILVMPNNGTLLNDLSRIKEKYRNICKFLYLKRDISTIKENFSKKNSDGAMHVMPEDFLKYYQVWDPIYTELADEILDLGILDFNSVISVIDSKLVDLMMTP